MSNPEEDWGNWAMQYEAIRKSGQTNMLDRNMVQKIAYESGFYALVIMIEEWTESEYVEQAETAVSIYEEVPQEKLPDVAYKKTEIWEK